MISQRIKELRKQNHLTQTALGYKMSVSKQAVSNWEQGRRDPNQSQRKKLCDIFGVTEAELFSEAHGIPANRIPVISWVHANKFEEIVDNFQFDEYIYTDLKEKNLFALKVTNDCMDPEFREGDIIIVDPLADYGNNDFIVIKDTLSTEATFKQLKKYGNKVILHPLNPKYKDIELDHKKQYTIVGKVVAKQKRYF